MKLITGGLGFVGRTLAARLLESGEKVRILDRRIPSQPLPPNCEYIPADVSDFAAVREACRNVGVVFNLVSLLPCSRAGRDFWRVNADGTANVLRASAEAGIRKVVHLSSSIVYGVPKEVPILEDSPLSPVGDYGKSKLAGENHCRTYMTTGLDVTILRPRFIVGPGRLGLLVILFEWIRLGRKIYTIGSGRNRFQMLSVDDLVEACFLAQDRAHGETINVGAEPVPTLYDLLSDLIRHARTPSAITPIPAWLARNSLRLLSLFNLSPLGIEHYLIADKEYVLDTTKARTLLGWTPKHDMGAALRSAYDWYCSNRETLSRDSEQDFPAEGFLRLLKLIS